MKKVCFALIAFVATWSGATSTRAGVPAGPYDNVRQYGATGNGTTDDTNAINRAIQQAVADGKMTVYFPPGVYLVNSIPTTQNNGIVYVNDNPLHTLSGISLIGDDPHTSILKMPADTSGQGMLSNRSIIVVGDPTYNRATAPTHIQQNIQITSLGFDLVNDKERRAIQLRYPVHQLTIDNCTGFQSDLQAGHPVISGPAQGDNSFFNMAVIGEGSSDITVEFCQVANRMQLTSDGGYGVTNLSIHDNIVDGAVSYGIAVTTVSPDSSAFNGLHIENNLITNPGATGILVGPDYSTRTFDFQSVNDPVTGKPRIYSTQNIFISNNTIALGNDSGANATGIYLTPMPFGTSNVQITGNTLYGKSGASAAIYISNWDLNWSTKTFAAPPVVPVAAFNASTGTIRLSAAGIPTIKHHLLTGMLIQLYPATLTDRLPPGITPFEYYRVVRLNDTDFSLTDLQGAKVSFQPSGAAGNFCFAFKPAIQAMTITNNAADDNWDKSLSLQASINSTVSSNAFPGQVRLVGEHHQLGFSGNVCTGLLSTWWQFSGTSFFGCDFADNIWLFDEGADNAVCCGTSAVLTFSPNDARRTMTYTFERNKIYITNSKGTGGWINGVRDSGAIGTVRASYIGNEVNPAARGYNCDAVNIVQWTNNIGTNHGH